MPKTLILMRHGQYTSGETNLNVTGEEQVDDVASQLVYAGLVPDVILHSPLQRAVDTATRVRDVFNQLSGKNIELCVCANLAEKRESPASDITDALDNTIETALVVSHMPNIFSYMTEMFEKVAPAYHARTYVLVSNTAEWSGFHGRKTGEYDPKTLSR